MVYSSFLQYSFYLPSVTKQQIPERSSAWHLVAFSLHLWGMDLLMMVSAELGQRHLPASLNSSPCAHHVRVLGNVMECMKLAAWQLPVLLGPEAVRTDVVPKWLVLLLLYKALCCTGRSSPPFCGREALFSSISHHSSLVELQQKQKAWPSVCVLLPHSTASFPQGKETPCLVSFLQQQPEICLTMIKNCSTARWRINSFCRRMRLGWIWLVESGFEKIEDGCAAVGVCMR